MIKVCRVVVCDGSECGNASLDLLRTIDPEKGEPDWQGWQEVADLSGTLHLCPMCVKLSENANLCKAGVSAPNG